MAYEITWEDVKNTAQDIADELDEFTSAQEKLVLDESTRRVPENRFNTDTFDARRYYASHLASLMITNSAGQGTVSSESIGGVSVGMTMPVNNPDAKSTILETQYGRNYYRIMQANYQPVYFG